MKKYRFDTADSGVERLYLNITCRPAFAAFTDVANFIKHCSLHLKEDQMLLNLFHLNECCVVLNLLTLNITSCRLITGEAVLRLRTHRTCIFRQTPAAPFLLTSAALK